MTRLLRSTLFASWIASHGLRGESDESPARLFRRAVAEWDSLGRRQWKPWHQFADALDQRFETARNRLEIVGGFEEGILLLESFIFNGQHHEQDAERDRALSRLYARYGKSLSMLSSNECVELSKDPHTLLIGAETIKTGKEAASNFICRENAENAFRNAVSIDSTNAEAAQLLASLTTDDGSPQKRKPKEFVAELFDSFADTFDEKLGRLGYTVPSLVGETAASLMNERRRGKPYAVALDAGCGTGLAGRFLRPMVSDILVGVDASMKMLDIARKCTVASGCGLHESSEAIGSNDQRPLYDQLLSLDLEEMSLSNTLFTVSVKSPAGFDLIVAADVLVYFGSLESVVTAFSKLSVPGSILIFSCELATEEDAPLGWKVQPSGRFSHAKQYVVATADRAGYELVSYQEIVPRMEKGEPIQGHLFGFTLRQVDSEL